MTKLGSFLTKTIKEILQTGLYRSRCGTEVAFSFFIFCFLYNALHPSTSKFVFLLRLLLWNQYGAKLKQIKCTTLEQVKLSHTWVVIFQIKERNINFKTIGCLNTKLRPNLIYHTSTLRSHKTVTLPFLF
jgi:hypothetical protein